MLPYQEGLAIGQEMATFLIEHQAATQRYHGIKLYQTQIPPKQFGLLFMVAMGHRCHQIYRAAPDETIEAVSNYWAVEGSPITQDEGLQAFLQGVEHGFPVHNQDENRIDQYASLGAHAINQRLLILFQQNKVLERLGQLEGEAGLAFIEGFGRGMKNGNPDRNQAIYDYLDQWRDADHEVVMALSRGYTS
jgi:hypothetical protein